MTDIAPLTDLRTIVKHLGRANMARRLNVQAQTVGAAIKAGVFPPAWYPIVNKMAGEAGIQVSDDAFNWREDQECA